MRFFKADLNICMDCFELDRDEAHHARVLRLRRGDTVYVINGKGLEVKGVLDSISSNKALVKVQSFQQVDKPLRSCFLGVAVPEYRSMPGLIIRSAVELGVTDICLLVTRYCGYRKTGDGQKFMHRWGKIVISACKQSGRLWFPRIPDPMDLSGFAALLPENTVTFVGLEPGLKAPVANLKSIPGPISNIAWVVGPEGGWSSEDCKQIALMKPNLIHLGSATLTTHVAAIAGISALMTYFDLWL